MTAATEYPPSLAEALARFQADLPRVGKDKKANAGTYSYAFADLADVVQAVSPALGRVGLSFSSRPTLTDDGRFVLAYALRHVSGDSDEGQYPLPDPSRMPPQQVGSAITYARRYSLCAVTGISPDEDDDGQNAARAMAAPAYDEPPRRQQDPDTAAILAEIGDLADALGIPRADVARDFAADYGVPDIRQGTVEQLQATRDALAAKRT